MPLLLGPVLRHVGETTAQVWVQTEGPARVAVLGCEASTFEVSGHHFALVPVTGLEPGSRTPYEVHVDGEQVWPPAAHPFPQSAIRTRGPGSAAGQKLVFGSCRYAHVDDPKLATELGIDALDAYAARMATLPPEEWPDALVLLGDQVYADELTPATRRRIANRGDRHPDWPDDEIVGFDEYVGLYQDAWSDPEIRWVLSTVPTAMIFDDHDIRDDWNTSAAWRATMQATSWWRTRIRSGLASYWIYQHLGNLPADELAADPDYAKVLAHGGDTWPLLQELADRADREADGVEGVRFSFRWELGRTRLVMIDSRNGRVLDHGRHLMLGDVEFAWVEEQVNAPGPDGGAVDHLVLGTSLPWLLPPAIGDLQTLDEVLAAKPGLVGRLGEKLRQGADLEHWPAFHESFDRLTDLVADAAERGPASVTVLSGDVHHSYAAQADLPGNVHQLVCSPVHNKLDWYVKPGFRFAWSRPAAALMARLAAAAGAPPPPLGWQKEAGPFFGNTIATLELDGRAAGAVFEQPVTAATLTERARLELTR